MMSDELKYEAAKELGISETIDQNGWGAISTKDAGNIVKKAIEIAERSIKNQ